MTEKTGVGNDCRRPLSDGSGAHVPESSISVQECWEMRALLMDHRAEVAACLTWNSLEHIVLKTERVLLQEVIEWHSLRSFAESP